MTDDPAFRWLFAVAVIAGALSIALGGVVVADAIEGLVREAWASFIARRRIARRLRWQ